MVFLYADGRLPLAMTAGGVNYYLCYDQVGTLRVVTDTSGAIVKQINYDSFGNVISDSNPSLAVPFGFAGGLYDPDTGLVHFGARDYDPGTGMWTAKDPILFGGGSSNLYGYVQNDPINFIDPLGLSAASQAAWRNFGAAAGLLLSLPVDAFEDLSTLGAGALANPATTAGMMVGGAALGTAIDAVLNGPMLSKKNDDSRCGSRHGGGKSQVDSVAREFGMNDQQRNAFGDYIEEIKAGEGRGGADNLSYSQLRELAKEFMGR
jgi:RHS repeat-associated protein